MAKAVVDNKTARDQQQPAVPELNTEVAHRLIDPFEQLYLGVLRTNDPLLLEKGNAGGGAEIYRDLKRDGKVFSTMQKRVMALVGRAWQVEPVEASVRGKADAETLTKLLKGMGFDRLCKELLEALLTGTAVCELVWTVKDGLYTVQRAPRRALRRFVFVQQDADQPPQLQLLTRENMLTGLPLPARKFIVHRINAEDDNPWGIGLGLQLYWAVFFKRKAMISWNKLNDRMGVPIPWGQYPASANHAQKSTLFDALKAMSNDGVIMTPQGSMITLLEAKAASGSITSQQALCEFMDDWIAEVVLGQEPRREGAGAPVAAGNERSDVRMDLVQADADLLSDTLNSTLIAWMCELNSLTPCLVSRVVKEEDDLQATAETDKTITEMGFELDETTVRARYGEGWSKKAKPAPAPPPGGALQPPAAPGAPGAPAAPAAPSAPQFAEAGLRDGQQAIDDAIDALPDDELQAAMRGVLRPLLQAIDQADSFEEALARAEAAYPRMDTRVLQSLLARAMFGAETFGRVTND